LIIIPKVFGLREIMSTTSSATLMTAPYLAWAFNRESLIGLLTNLLALPLIPWSMLWGTVATLTSDLVVSRFVSLPAHGLLKTILIIAGLSDYFLWLDLKFQFFSFYFMSATYLCLWRLWLVLNRDQDLSTEKIKHKYFL